MLDRKFLLGTTVIAGLAAAALVAPTVALAQTAAPAATPAPAADDEDEDEGDVSALVITGSRIKRTEFTSSSPIQVITSEQSTLEGLVDTAEILQQSSIASGSFQVNNQLTGYVTDGGPGANTISLRGLGATRTLVLLNGKRVGPAGTRGTVGPVDLNVIPSSIVERYEILKDGASSIYGSDAVAGVINIITKSNFDGIELNAYANVPFETGGEQYRLSGSWGKTFDRGYINGSFDYRDSKILRRGDRDDTACSADYLFSGTGYKKGARVDYPNTDPGQPYANDQYKCYGLFSRVLRTPSSSGYGDVIYQDAGVTYPSAAQGNTVPNVAVNGDFFARQGRSGYPATFPYGHYDAPQSARASILSPAKLYSAFFSGGFDIAPNVEAYGELLLNRRESNQYGARQLFPTVTSDYTGLDATRNAFFAPAGGNYLPIIPLKSDRDQKVDYWRSVVGLRGDIGRFSWDVYYQHSDSDATYATDIIYNDRVLATTGGFRQYIDPATDPDGDGPLEGTLYTAAQYGQKCFDPGNSYNISGYSCTALPNGIDWTSKRILEGQFNDAERAFLFKHESGNTKYKQDMVEASVSGDLFNLPAGPLGAAFGVTYRRDEIDDQPGFNEASGNLWGSTAAGRTKGSDSVYETFGELEVPILKGLPGIESLDMQVSGRYTDYDSYGSGTTYKVGLNWQITPSWRIRGSKGTSFRAPALYELYLADQTSFTNQGAVDPCGTYEDNPNPLIQANCAAAGVPIGYIPTGSSILITTGGGAGVLKAETSDAYTVGVIWTPSFIDLSVAVEYFDYLVNDEIRQFGAANIAYQCYSSNNYPNDPFCTLLERAAASDPDRPNQILTLNNSYVNVAEQVNRGIDLTLRYQHEFDFGRLTFDGQFTWQTKDTTQLLGGAATEDYNGTTTEPDFTGSMSLRFDRGDWTVFWNTDLIGKQSDTETFGGDVFSYSRYADVPNGVLSTNCNNPANYCVYYKQYAEFTAYHSVSVRKKMDDWTFQAGIQNLFDERPPSASAGQFRSGTAALNLYDVRGRRGFIAITKRW